MNRYVVDQWFSNANTVREWSDWYKDDRPRSLTIQNVVSRKRFALKMLADAVPSGSKVLDIGCGAGAFAMEMASRGYDVSGVDRSEAMICHARENVRIVQFKTGDIEHLEFPDNTFDAVTCLGVIEYLDSDESALKEIWRVLKPGGKAIIATPSSSSPFYRLDRFLSKVVAAGLAVYGFLKYRLRGRPLPLNPDWETLRSRRYSRRRWLGMLQSMGFQPEEYICHTWGCYALERFFNGAALSRMTDRFTHMLGLNRLGSSQIVRILAIK